MHRIDTSDRWERRGYGCVECESTNWRVNNGTFHCRRCGVTRGTLLDKASGEELRREEIEFVGPHAEWKAPYSASTEK